MPVISKFPKQGSYFVEHPAYTILINVGVVIARLLYCLALQ